MAYDHEEQEQMAMLKAWWKQYGNLVTWALILALAAYAGWTGWGLWERNQSTQAALLYDGLEKSVLAKDNAKVQRAAADIQDRYSRTAYAQMSALVAARNAYDAGDLAAAKSQLQWTIDKGRDEEFRTIARVRLAGLLADEKKFDEALKVLSVDASAQFASMIADRRGDILALAQKVDEARAAYRSALEKSDAKNPARQLIQIKLDALGSKAG
ncbi:tetratricopeptide repeat protein [Lacisediminimonas sp.]|uniref:YfgM family protein n=1 Tax=Lacisediminimonas sp. TaxID=3060582 RepID=UPI00271A902D|nr:tetratricopeptide repeat protein [Lacisediminimonas sp.]MDO8298912.1 tetratricopeptide repeat protein [Lacisediminimonas sp.]MDO9216444.1 tetratricopeptide repeat protein [Lacisediminimonas sp.]